MGGGERGERERERVRGEGGKDVELERTLHS